MANNKTSSGNSNVGSVKMVASEIGSIKNGYTGASMTMIPPATPPAPNPAPAQPIPAKTGK